MARNTELPLAQATAPRGEEGTPESDGNQWWRNLAFVLLLVLLARLSLYFLTLVGMVIFFSDQRRNRFTRLGGTILMGWWLLSWSWSAAPPIIAAGLLIASAAAFVAAVRLEQGRRWPSVRNAALAGVAVLLAVLNYVPWGLREPAVDRAEALQIALANRRGTVNPTDAQIVPTRERFTQRPVYAVLLFERNGDKVTADNEPCFRRLDTHIVDGVTGAADRRSAAQWVTLDPLLDQTADEVAEARERDGFCLRVPRGISRQVVPVTPSP
jgi:hypothetical protein